MILVIEVEQSKSACFSGVESAFSGACLVVKTLRQPIQYLYQFEALILFFSFMYHVSTYPAMKKELMSVKQIYCQKAHI
jgi:hypothetical protein